MNLHFNFLGRIWYFPIHVHLSIAVNAFKNHILMKTFANSTPFAAYLEHYLCRILVKLSNSIIFSAMGWFGDFQ